VIAANGAAAAGSSGGTGEDHSHSSTDDSSSSKEVVVSSSNDISANPSAAWQSYDPDYCDYFDDDDTELPGDKNNLGEKLETEQAGKMAAATSTSSPDGGTGAAAAAAVAVGSLAAAAAVPAGAAASGNGGSSSAASRAAAARRGPAPGPGLSGSLPETPVDKVVAATVSAWVWLITAVLAALNAVRKGVLIVLGAVVRPVVGLMPRATQRQLRQLVSVCGSFGVECLHACMGLHAWGRPLPCIMLAELQIYTA